MLTTASQKALYQIENILFKAADESEYFSKIEQILKQMDQKQFEQLCLQAVEEGYPKIATVILKVSEKEAEHVLTDDFIVNLVKSSASHGNAKLLSYLEKDHKTLVAACPLAKKLLEHPNKERIEKLVSRLVISRGISPRLRSHSAQLLIAAKKEKNPSSPSILVLDNMREDYTNIDHFLKKLSSLIDKLVDPLRIPIVYIDEIRNHWITGEIYIHNHAVEILIIDSLGAEDMMSTYTLTTNEALKKMDIYFPQATIYCSAERLQHKDHDSCTLFSMDNALHLRNADQFLPKGYTDKTLYDYLKDHIIQKHILHNKTEVTFVSLPLRFIRAMQSLKSKNDESPLKFITHSGIFERLSTAKKAAEDEVDISINKKGEHTEQSVRQHLDDTAEINQRIQYKVASFREEILNFLLAHDQAYIDEVLRQSSPDKMLQTLENPRVNKP